MTINKDEEKLGEGSTIAQTPGAMLKAAREQRGLTIEEVAKSLYVTRRKVLAIEGDIYDELNSHVFIKGYFRNYAPLVGLDADKLIVLYEELADDLDDTFARLETKDYETPSTLVPKFIVPAALFGVAVLVLITIFIYSGDEESTATAPVTPASNIDENLAEQVAANSLNSLVSDVEDQTNPKEPIDQPSVELVPTIPEGDDALALSSSPQSASDITGPSLAEPKLEFQFAEDCWLQVRDQSNTIIYTGIAKAGENLQLQGEPPFFITLGNAETVTLTWNGESVVTQPRPGYRKSEIVVGE